MRTFYTLFLSLLTCLARAQPPGHQGPAQATLEFFENKGQWEEAVRYTAPLVGGGQLFAMRDGLRIALLENGALAHGGHAEPADAAAQRRQAARAIRGHAFDLRFVGASAAAQLLAGGITNEHRNYFKGKDPAHWAADVRSYRELRYADLWPGVEARFYENDQQQLEYDFTLAPGTSPAAIGLRHEGADVTLDALGNLQIATSVGIVRELAPQAWQPQAGGGRRAVPCRYRLDAKGTVRFELGAYDTTQPLIIDPTVVFSGYTGSTAINWGFTATYDAAGNLYSGGIAFSLGFPNTAGAFQTTFGGIIDMALIKYDVTQKGAPARVWATYVGGRLTDLPHSMVVSSQGELLVLGSTDSPDFPVTATALQRRFAGGTPANPFGNGSYQQLPQGSDMVVCRLSATGAALRASTYLGGSGNDGLLPVAPYSYPTNPQLAHNFGDAFRGDILVDAADNVYIASCTSSTNFPLGASSFQRSYRGGTSDAVVCKLKGDLSAVLWGGYLGGGESDAVYSVQIEPASGDVYVAGGTLSADLPATAGAFKPTWSGNVDGFVTRIAASGASLVRTTYLGTTAYDQAYFLQLGGDGGVYVLGQTAGSYPTTPGLYGTVDGRQFIHKLDAGLSRTQLATVFGAGRKSVDISLTAFLVDRCDRVYVCGWGGGANRSDFNSPYLDANKDCSTNGLPVTAYAVQSRTDGSDFYLAQFATGLTGLSYGTFLGGYVNDPYWGEHVDGGTSRFDPRGVVYQAVCSCGTGAGFPVPPGANYYTATSGAGGNCNNAAFVLNFQPDVADVGPPQTVCSNATAPLVGSPAGGVWTGPGVSGSVATGYLFTPPAVGTYSLTYTVTSGLCVSSATRAVTVVPVPVVRIDSVLPPAYCAADGTVLPITPLVGSPAGGVFSGPGVTGAAGSQVFNPNLVSGLVELTYTYNVGCPLTATRQLEIVRISAGASQATCSSAAPISLVGSHAGGVWTGPGVSGSLAAGYVFTPATAPTGTNTLTYTVPTRLCTGSATRQITVVSAPTVRFDTVLPSAYCAADGAVLPVTPLVGSPAGGMFSGPGVTGYLGNQSFNPNLVSGLVELTYTYSAGCQLTVTRRVEVVRANAGSGQTLCGNASPVYLYGSPAGGAWAGPGVSGSVSTGYVFTPSAASPGLVTLTYTQTAQDRSCAAVSTRRITVLDAAPTVLTPLPAPLCVSNTTRYQLVATPAGGNWYGSGISFSGGNYYFTPSQAGRGTFTLYYAPNYTTSCSPQRSMTVTVLANLQVALPADTLLCVGTTRAFRLSGASPAGGTWTGTGVSGSTATGFFFTPPAGFTGSTVLTYEVASGGCSGTATRRVGIAPEPAMQVAWAPVDCPEARQVPLVVRFTNAGGGAATRWDFGDGTPPVMGAEVLHTYQQAGRFQPRVSLRYLNAQCETTAPLQVIETQNQIIPNIISPNGNPANRYFRLPPGCAPRLELFSRWGQLVHAAAEYRNDWNATGHPAGIYYYLLTYPSGQRVKGWLEVIK